VAEGRPITFLSDYGYEDEFAGVCRAVIARIAPDVPVIDLTHGIPRLDVAQGAARLANALPYTPAGVHLAVVDPGVGSDRRAVAVRVAAEERLLVGPDNGLLGLAIERLGGAVEAVDIGRSPVRLEPVSATFHGRDVFAPVAAHLALGMAPAALGEPFDHAELVTLERPPARVDAGARITATVGYVDHFGNATLIAATDLATEAGLEPGARVSVGAGGVSHPALYALTFADVDRGELIVYGNSSGGLAIAVNRGSAAEQLGVGAGDEVVIEPA